MRQFIFALSSAIVLSILISGCVKDRPITHKPDAENDLRDKVLYTGSSADPAFWAYKVTVVNTSANDGFVFTGYQSKMKVGYFDFSRKKLNNFLLKIFIYLIS